MKKFFTILLALFSAQAFAATVYKVAPYGTNTTRNTFPYGTALVGAECEPGTIAQSATGTVKHHYLKGKLPPMAILAPCVPVTVPDPAPTPTPSDLVFRDTFDYVVNRDTAGAATIFRQHGWNGAKTVQDGQAGARGYVYTVSSIPGFSGTFPSGNRALVLEALPATLGFQTDFYLEYGDGENPAFEGAIPANAWFRFWLYMNHVPSQPSQMDENKFVYACNSSYPCHEYHWMLSLANGSADPLWNYIDGSQGDAYLNLSAAYAEPSLVTNPDSRNPGYEWRMGQNNITERIRPNRWQEITLHVDTSTNNGVWEAWIQPLGGVKVKVANFVSGQNGFQWNISAPRGHRTFRMPTTVGRANGSGFDQWLYMQNFRIARSEAGLN